MPTPSSIPVETNGAAPLRLAAVCTIYRPLSHADVILRRWWDPLPMDRGYGWTGPRSRIASLYVDQFPDGDMSREACRREGVPLCDTIEEALTLGGHSLAVDGVLLIGEHGDYPFNELGQQLYPRKEMFDRVVAVFRRTGRCVPVFNDKHLSWSFDWAKQMHDTAAAMGFVLFSGSSVPHTLRVPPCAALGGRVREAVALFYGGDEAYGFHSFDFAQSVIELAPGRASGVKAVTAYTGEGVWRMLDAHPTRLRLLEAALVFVPEVKPGDIRANCAATKVNPWGPTAFVLDLDDGSHVTHLNLSGHAGEFAIALEIEGEASPVATRAPLPEDERFYPHFAALSAVIDHAMHTRRHPFAPQRSLLTTGLTAAAMRARVQPETPLPTPELLISYEPFFDGPTLWRNR